jgi:hypothetical protein
MEGSTKALWIMVDGGSAKNMNYINVMMVVAGFSEPIRCYPFSVFLIPIGIDCILLPPSQPLALQTAYIN